jgi:hypothetical protein
MKYLILSALLASPAAAQVSTSGSAVLDEAMTRCAQHRAGAGYDAGYELCARLEQRWLSAAMNYARGQWLARLDASNYATAEPPELQDKFVIERALK